MAGHGSASCGSVRISETPSVGRSLWPLRSALRTRGHICPPSGSPLPGTRQAQPPHLAGRTFPRPTTPPRADPGPSPSRPPRHPGVAPARGPQLQQQPRVTAQGRQTQSKAAKIKTHRIPRTSGHTQSSLPERRSRGPPGAGPQSRPDPGGHGGGGGRARGGGPGLAASSRAPPRGSPARQPPRGRPRGRDLRTG